MGRRAKNKQAAPVPFVEVKASSEKPSAKKLGKRKQSPEQENRPLKKVKAKTSTKSLKDEAKTKKSSKQKAKKAGEDDDEDSGWEGVQDLNEEKKCVLLPFLCSIKAHWVSELFSRTVMAKKLGSLET